MTQNIITQIPQIFYSLPLRDVVVFPHTTATILVGRKKSISAVQSAKKTGVPIFAVTQTNPESDAFDENSIYSIGTICSIVETTKMADGNVKVVIQGLLRGKINKILPSEGFYSCEIDLLADAPTDLADSEFMGLKRSCIKGLNDCAKYNKKITPEVISTISKTNSPYDFIYMMVPFLNASLDDRQKILEEDDVVKKLYKIASLIQTEINISESELKISRNIQEKIAKSQRDLYLGEQLKYIKKELGHEEEGECEDLKKKVAKLKLPKEVVEKCNSEISKLEKANPFSSEAGVMRSYLDWILQLPWSSKTTIVGDLDKASKILDKDHYALEKVKDRILEFIAVQIKTSESKGPIICLVGPPGVGKTSLAKSIASALNRKYVKVSLGGVRDESEIRGHRRTYIGSLPGRIIQSMKKAKKTNPLMLLDEIDKMSSDMRGDPASALLEVLDPEQNKNFSDHYLEVDYDLSKVMFVATANDMAGIPIPLRDRMEIIKLSGYTESEKLEIAKKHLISKQRKEHGLSLKEFKVSDQSLLKLIRNHTFEAGVRNLNREIANLARKVVRDIISNKAKTVQINENNLSKYSGVEKFDYGKVKKNDQIGVATGLAYTQFGGDLLDIEAIKFNGSGKIQITGQLGDVMKESAQAALSYVRSIAQELKINEKEFNKYDFHIHVPQGATPKDGPSAGVALCLALLSCISNLPVNKNIAVTGEITLTGKVLEIGGLKEKLLAALRGKIKTVIIPKSNKKDLEELPKEILDNLNIKIVANVTEAFKLALIGYEDKILVTKKGRAKKVSKKSSDIIPELEPLRAVS